MSNNTTLAAILAHPRVREYGDARGWYSEMCDKCFSLHTTNNVGALAPWGAYCKQAILHRNRTPRYTGPDLSKPESLHELLGLADELSDFDVDVMADCEPGPEHFSATMYSDANEETGESEIHRGTGPTRADAVIAAIARALNIGDKA